MVMKPIQFLLAMATMSLCMQSAAMSKLFEEGVAATIKGGIPCFYLYLPENRAEKLSLLTDYEVSVATVGEGQQNYWSMPFSTKIKAPPENVGTCLQYGETRGHGAKAKPLDLRREYRVIFSSGQWRYGAWFCLQTTKDGTLFVAATDNAGTCLDQPLPSVPGKSIREIWRGFWK